MPGKKTRKKFTKCFEKLLRERIVGEDVEEKYKEHLLRKIDNMDGNDFGMYVMLGVITSEFLEQNWLEAFMAGCEETLNA